MSAPVRSVLLTSRPPWPPLGGDRLRTLHLARALASLGPLTIVACGAPPPGMAEGLAFADSVQVVPLARGAAALRVMAAAIGRQPLQQALYDAPGLGRATAEAIRGADVVVAHLLRTVAWVPEVPPPLVVCLQDALADQAAEAGRSGGTAGGWRRLALRVEGGRLRDAELRAALAADAVTAITERDRDLFVAAGVPAARITVVPAQVDRIASAPHAEPTPDRIVFAGNLRTASNRDMAVHLARRILPRVRSERWEARLRIVGIEAPREVRRLDSLPGVDVVGAVDDMHAELALAWATACPLRFGSGVQNKVLESLAAGTPAVVTSRVLDTLHADAAGAVLTGDHDRALALALVRLLGDRALRDRLAAAGLAFVRAHHGAEALQPLVALVARLAAR